MKIGGRVTGTHQRVSFDAASHATTSQLHLSRGAFHDSPVGGTAYQVPNLGLCMHTGSTLISATNPHTTNQIGKRPPLCRLR